MDAGSSSGIDPFGRSSPFGFEEECIGLCVSFFCSDYEYTVRDIALL